VNWKISQKAYNGWNINSCGLKKFFSQGDVKFIKLGVYIIFAFIKKDFSDKRKTIAV